MSRKPTFELGPGSLCGLWFQKLEDGEVVWQGRVITEVHAGSSDATFLLALEFADGSRHKRLVNLEQMTALSNSAVEWLFFDTVEELRDAFANRLLEQEAQGT